ncbi:MAG: DUF4424 domain-containing protein [Rhodobacteraceae bacterium]|jgi:hypothetical protein|nr:DUF4424 domain-containing protein [Paracoccaceae bacterium]
MPSLALRALLLSAALLAPPAHANDGFGGLTATGLEFGQTEAVAMESEDLRIDPDRITVDYVFRNTTAEDVTGEVIFPLPPISLWSLWEGMMNLPEPPMPENLVGFTATVDGKPVEVRIDRIAVVEPPWMENRPPSDSYDTPGRDVTADLAKYGLPLTLDPDAAMAALLDLPPADRQALQDAGLAEYFDADPGNQIPEQALPGWSIVLRYHWTQTFPAGTAVRVQHQYQNRPPGGIFGWVHPLTEEEAYLQDYVSRYCIDDGTSAAMAKALETRDPATGEIYNYGTAWFITYVLRTANSWAGPIGTFRLTLDKGDASNLVSLCAEGVRKTGPTTFVVEKTDYTPDRDLDILLVSPPGG